MDQDVRTTFRIERPDEGGLPPTAIGRLGCDGDGRLRLLESDPAYTAALEGVVEAVNGQEALRVKVPPPPEAEERGVWWSTITRDHPDDLVDSLPPYFEQKYNLLLTPD